jgi:hypothetical protein
MLVVLALPYDSLQASAGRGELSDALDPPGALSAWRPNDGPEPSDADLSTVADVRVAGSRPAMERRLTRSRLDGA